MYMYMYIYIYMYIYLSLSIYIYMYISVYTYIYVCVQGWLHREGRGSIVPSLLYVAKRKKGNKGKKERVPKQKLLKGSH